MLYTKKNIITIIITILILISACAYKNDSTDISYESSVNDIENNLKPKKHKEDKIEFTILGQNTISISMDRIEMGYLDNRWNLSEIDDILNSIKGIWTIDKYIGFVAPKIYFPDINDIDVREDVRENWLNCYDEKIRNSRNNIPNFYLSIRETNGSDTRTSNSNYIHVNGNYLSPISVILSINVFTDYQPAHVSQTAVSHDFVAEYPVLYIKFFIKNTQDNSVVYKPATLVITSDNRFYVLIEGAFYSLVRQAKGYL